MKLYGYILSLVSPGATILELGSGWASSELSRHLKVYSIEHDQNWLNKYKTNYIYAPIVDGWYSIEHLKGKLPASYDLILVDGPTGWIGRHKFFDNIHLFKTNVPIIFDDVNRDAEYKLMMKIAELLKRQPHVVKCGNKSFGALIP